MINKKLFLTIASLSLLYTGCNESKETPKQEEQEKQVKQEIQKPTETKMQKVVQVEPNSVVEETQVKQKTSPIKITTVTLDGHMLYKKCASCHGQNAQKKALNKSAIIKDWDATQIQNALLGYKAGTYGGAMQGVMKAQVSNLSEKDIEILAKHISDFK